MDVSLAIIVILLVAGLVLLWRIRSQSQHMFKQDSELYALRRDIQQTRRTLKSTEELMTTLANASFDALLVVDSRHIVTALNQAAQDLFDVTEMSIGKTLMNVTQNHELDAMVDSVFKGGEALESQFEFNEHFFRVRGVLVGTSLTLAMQDISELIRLARARRDMVANMSHDLRTPVSTIRMVVDSLARNFEKHPERVARDMPRVVAATDNLQHMIEELIELSTIESGKAIIRMVNVDFAEILNGAYQAMATQLEEKHLEFINKIPPSLRVLADPKQTVRVLTNLIHNSIKYTPSGGQIKFTSTQDANMVTFCMMDTGPGIPPQERKRIFERFYQVDAARTEKGQTGSGLGLSIAKHIIEAQGGKIWAEAGDPSGACFCFTLSLAEDEKKRAAS